ncbi:MAG: hypothetical protein JWP01_945 [Myxococcales bacterium]|nr:hypothetical protein [Myxococcales bacterium]
MIALVLATALASAKPGLFVAKGRFSVRFPDAVETRQEVVPAEAGAYTTHFFSSGIGQTAFGVTFTDFPVELGAAELRRAVDGETTGQGQVVARRPHTLGKVRGLEVTYRGSAPSDRRMEKTFRMYVRGRTMYQIWVAGPADAVPRKEVTRFFASFKLR